MPNPRLRRGQHTNPLIWLLAILCAIVATAVIISGIVVFAIYTIYQPKQPYIKVIYAHLDKLVYDQTGSLDTKMTLTVVAENDNAKAHATFYDARFLLGFRGTAIAELRAGPFVVPKNGTIPLNYVVASSGIPLDVKKVEAMSAEVKENRVGFDLSGEVRTRWKVGVFVSVKNWAHLSCLLQFFPLNGSSLGLDCSSKSH